MKKLALAIAALASAAAPVFACPHEDKAENNNDAKTAEKQKQEKQQDQAKKEAAPKKETAKPAKPAEKKTDKVSQK